MLENKYDIYEPLDGHFARFSNKLDKRKSNKKFFYYRVAASIILVVAGLKPYTTGFSGEN